MDGFTAACMTSCRRALSHILASDCEAVDWEKNFMGLGTGDASCAGAGAPEAALRGAVVAPGMTVMGRAVLRLAMGFWCTPGITVIGPDGTGIVCTCPALL